MVRIVVFWFFVSLLVACSQGSVRVNQDRFTGEKSAIMSQLWMGQVRADAVMIRGSSIALIRFGKAQSTLDWYKCPVLDLLVDGVHHKPFKVDVDSEVMTGGKRYDRFFVTMSGAFALRTVKDIATASTVEYRACGTEGAFRGKDLKLLKQWAGMALGL